MAIVRNNLRTQECMYLSGLHLDSAGDPRIRQLLLGVCGIQKPIDSFSKNIRTKATLWDDNYRILLSTTIPGFGKERYFL